MTNEIKEIYLSNLEWTKTHDNDIKVNNDMGGVMGNIVFKDNMSYEEYQKLFKSGYFILCDKDYITKLQEENKHLKWERDSYYEDIICYIRNTMHVKDKKARKTFDKVSMDWSSSTIYLTLCELDKDLRGDE